MKLKFLSWKLPEGIKVFGMSLRMPIPSLKKKPTKNKK